MGVERSADDQNAIKCKRKIDANAETAGPGEAIRRFLSEARNSRLLSLLRLKAKSLYINRLLSLIFGQYTRARTGKQTGVLSAHQ